MSIALTPRQQEVCNLMVLGLSNKEIARRLGIGWRTIEYHRHAIYVRSDVRNIVELIRKVYKLDERGLSNGKAEESVDSHA